MLDSTFSQEELQSEVWRLVPIEPYGQNYEVSNLGRVKRSVGGSGAKAGRILSPHRTKLGYLTVILSFNGIHRAFIVHRLTAIAFVVNPNGLPEVNHKDGNKSNNRTENLEWVTPSQNKRHAIDILGVRRGERHAGAKLTEQEVIEIRKLHAGGHGSHGELAKRFGMSKGTIKNIVARRRWKHVK